jgi:cyclopropane fatty-acyl-phospholipid synthase-like methyltransferase
MENTNFFDDSYKGTPPWDVGHAQTEFVSLFNRGEVKGSVIDVGCGTGENSLFFASKGNNVLGVDYSVRAIEKAREKAVSRKIENVTFEVVDVLTVSKFFKERAFENVIDSGLFHTFDDSQRPDFVKSLRSVVNENGKYFMLCFSDLEPANWGGPRRVTRREIEDSFQEGWKINYIREASFETNIHQNGAKARLSSITRTFLA